VNRSSLARVNEQQPHELYEALFGKLLARCQATASKHRFRFKNKLYSLDASTIDLCLSVFPWAKFRTTKGAIKLHVGLGLQQFLRLLQLNLFERRDLQGLLRGDLPVPNISPMQTRLQLA